MTKPPFHFAAFINSLKVTRLLIENRADTIQQLPYMYSSFEVADLLGCNRKMIQEESENILNEVQWPQAIFSEQNK